jgi:predicted transcriptional regulator
MDERFTGQKKELKNISLYSLAIMTILLGIVPFTTNSFVNYVSFTEKDKDSDFLQDMEEDTRSSDFTDEKYLVVPVYSNNFGNRLPAVGQKKIQRTDFSFKPSIKILLRIMKSMLENNPIGQTALSSQANVNYTVLLQHLSWMKRKSLATHVLVDSKAGISMTDQGREFVVELNNLDLQFATLFDKI